MAKKKDDVWHPDFGPSYWDSSTVFTDKQCEQNRKRIAKSAGASLESLLPSLEW